MFAELSNAGGLDQLPLGHFASVAWTLQVVYSRDTPTAFSGVKRLAVSVRICVYYVRSCRLCDSVCLSRPICLFVRIIKPKRLKLKSRNLASWHIGYNPSRLTSATRQLI